jgi:hypothetical protein
MISFHSLLLSLDSQMLTFGLLPVCVCDGAGTAEAYAALQSLVESSRLVASRPHKLVKQRVTMSELMSEISVVIPTRNRPEMVVAAVQSALFQTVSPLEVIVVIDGPEDASVDGRMNSTARRLEALADPRVRLFSLKDTVGGAEARNFGVRVARSFWIAFLDDDDLWFPKKLQVQMDFAAQQDRGKELVLSCRVIARSPVQDEYWPRRVYDASEPIANYLFCRRGWRYGEALLQTTTLLAPRALLLRVPFTSGLKKHQDWDWLLRVESQPAVRIQHVGSEPLAVFHIEGGRQSVGRVRDWRFSLQWIEGWKHAMGREAVSGFVVNECAPQMRDTPLAEQCEFLRHIARERLIVRADLLRLLAFLCIPTSMRRALREGMRSARSWQLKTGSGRENRAKAKAARVSADERMNK